LPGISRMITSVADGDTGSRWKILLSTGRHGGLLVA
jgi:hypothetical protein